MERNFLEYIWWVLTTPPRPETGMTQTDANLQYVLWLIIGAIFWVTKVRWKRLGIYLNPIEWLEEELPEKFYNYVPKVDMPSNITNVYSNKYCLIQLYKDNNTIYIEESIKPYRTFKVKRSECSSDIWTILTKNFTKNTRYRDIESICRKNKVQIVKPIQTIEQPVTPIKAKPTPIDINNADEKTLTKLPGINIAIAKKIIKKRIEIGEFKDIEEFIKFIKVKSHFEKQIRNQIYISKKKGIKKFLPKFKERNVDI